MKYSFESSKSSNIARAEYESDTRRMVVTFKGKSGETRYSYEHVPPADWDAFHWSKSKGEHFAKEIRGKHKGVKL